MRYDELQALSKIDLASRLAVFNVDVDGWTDAARIKAAGLSDSQRVALVDMIGALKDRQKSAVQKLTQASKMDLFGEALANFILETTGANELWRLFRFILEQGTD